MNNAEMLLEYVLADADCSGDYEHLLYELDTAYACTSSMGSDFTAALDAEILRKLMHYKTHCTIETATDMVPHTRKYLAWDL